MDTTDPSITFDGQGACNHCRQYATLAAHHVRSGEDGKRELHALVERIRAEGRRKRYDCIIGVSGGVDSTYVAYVVKQLALRPLAVHMDNGWDSELAVGNIEKTLKTLGIDLYTDVLDWDEFKDLQLAFLEASVPDGEIPTDHAIAAVLYRMAVREGVRFIISGSNTVTEGILPRTWTYGVNDWRYIRGIHRRFGTRPLTTFPHYGFGRLMYYSSVRRIRSIRVLDYVPYVRSDAMRVLQEELGWKYYGGKHYESIYTRFFQGYVLPRKFGIDKRRAHLATLICSGQISRERAIAEMLTDPYPKEIQDEDRNYVVKKLGISQARLDAILALPRKSYRDYSSYDPFIERTRRFVTRTGLKRVLRPIVRPGGI